MLRIIFFIVIASIAQNSYACRLARTHGEFTVTQGASSYPIRPNFKIVKLHRGSKIAKKPQNSCSWLATQGWISFQLQSKSKNEQGYIFEVVAGRLGNNSLFSKKPVKLSHYGRTKNAFDFRWSDYPNYYRQQIYAKIKITAVSASGRKSKPQYIQIRPKRNSTRAHQVPHSHNRRGHSHSLPREGIKHRHSSSAGYGKLIKKVRSTKTKAIRTRPIPHSHNGRGHSHSLPQEGVKHRHSSLAGFGKLIKKVRNTKTKVTHARSVSHSHRGRVHSHLLPKKGISHSHGSLGIGKHISQGVSKSKKANIYKNYIPKYISIYGPRIVGRNDSFSVKDVAYGGIFRRLPHPIVRADYKITPSEKALRTFRAKLDRINVWKWKKKYYSPRTEAWKSNVSIIYPDKQVTVSMVSKGPGNYNQFVDALLELVEHKKHVISHKEYTKKLQASLKRPK